MSGRGEPPGGLGGPARGGPGTSERVLPGRTRVPPVGRGLPRPRLTDRLDAAADGALVLVAAPAGYGKTTLLADWARQRGGRGHPVAWFTAEPTDDSVYRVWTAVLAALTRAGGLSAGPGGALAAPRAAGDTAFHADLVAAIARPAPVLVVDDLHEVTGPEVLGELDVLLRHRPAGMTVVLSTRRDPPLPEVVRERLRGSLHEIRASDLAFAREETAAVCPDLSEDQLDRIDRMTEGWPALVRLVDVSGLPLPDPDAPELTTPHGVAEHLFDDLLGRFDAPTQWAMLLTSVPDTVTPEAAAELTGRPDMGEVLDRVADGSGLVARVADRRDGARLRYHPLLRARLLSELRRRDVAAYRRANALSARWAMASGAGPRAVRHAYATSDPEVLDAVLAEAGPAMLTTGEADLLLRLLDGADFPPMPRTAWSSALRAAALVDLGRVAEADCELVAAEAAAAPGDDAAGENHGGPDRVDDLAALRDATRVLLDRRLRGVRTADPPEGTVPARAGNPDVHLLHLLQRGIAALALPDDRLAEDLLAGAARLAEDLGRSPVLMDAWSWTAALRGGRGDVRGMVELARRTLEYGDENGWGADHRAAPAHALLSFGSHLTLDDDTAAAHAAEALSLTGPASEPATVLLAHTVRALADPAGPTGEAASDLTALVLDGAPGAVAPATSALAALAAERAELHAGRPDRAVQVLARLRAGLGPCAELTLAVATLEVATGRAEQALARLRTVTRGTDRAWTPFVVVEAHLLAARLALGHSDEYVAVEHVRAALDLVADHGAPRPLLESVGALRDLLVRNVGRWGRHEALVADVLARSPVRRGPGVVLTRRELELLRELPNLNTVADIAESLHVSTNTVKTHLRGVYRKLGVSTRREAVSEARRVGLL